MNQRGHSHLLTQVGRQIVNIFRDMGFAVIEGPEIETEWYNFDTLNMPKNHPARDMQATLHIADGKNKLLRTQTSAVQVKYMENNEPPYKIISPGRVFRRDASDASHSSQFYQLEGFSVTKDASMAELKGVLSKFIEEFFGKGTKIRWRPGYFPFVEPGMEVDIQCSICGGKGCPTCKRKGWVEVLGAGMIHPKVLAAAKYKEDEWQGYAFGLGLDRLAMMKYQINDIRLLYSGDLRFLKQF